MRYPALQFADDTGVSQDLAERVIDAIYEHDELDVCDVNSVLWRLKDFIMKTRIPELLDELSDEDIKSIVNDVVSERKQWMQTTPSSVCCAETIEELQAAFAEGNVPEAAWFFSQIDGEGKTFKAGDVVTVQILRAGEWNHPSYGKVKITKQVIKDIVQNFKDDARGIDLAVDENHDPDHKALAWFKEVYSESNNTKAFAKVELTQKGADVLNDGSYKYFSPEFTLFKMDEETGEPIKNLLVGGALTNRPFFKGMQPLMASEDAAGKQSSNGSALEGQAYFFSNSTAMHKLMMLMDKLVQKDTITASEKSQLEQLFAELPESERANVKIKGPVDEVLAKFDEGDGEEKPEAAEEAEAADKGDGGDAKTEESDDGDEDEDDADEAKPEVPAEVEGVQANEDGSYTITDSVKFTESLKGIQSNASKLSLQFKEIETRKKLKTLKFSEKNTKGILLPKHMKAGKFLAFAMKLSEPMLKDFMEAMKTLEPFDPAKFSELGHDKETKDVDPLDPKTFTAEDETVQFYMESMGQSLEDAQKSAATLAAAKSGKPLKKAVKA